jgi:hypothetical protein
MREEALNQWSPATIGAAVAAAKRHAGRLHPWTKWLGCERWWGSEGDYQRRCTRTAADQSWRLEYAEGAASGCGCGYRATTLAAEDPAAAAVGAVAELVAAEPVVAEPAVAGAEDAAGVAAEPAAAAAGDGTSSSRRAQSWWAEACRWWRGIGSPC